MVSGDRHHAVSAVVIDDNEAHRELMRGLLEDGADGASPMTVSTYADADEALANLPPDGPVVVICDYRLAGASGIDWLPDFIRADVGPVIIVTSAGDEATAAAAFRHGAADYVAKSDVFEQPERLRNAITEVLRRFKLERTNRELARDLKLANAELQRKNVVLAELTETAHRFVDDVAHEFRTPLAVIKEFASIMSDGIGGEVTEKQAEFLRFITHASRDLAHLVDDFLDSGKLRARTLRVERREHAVADLVEGAWPMLESRATAKRVVVESRLVGDLPPVFADADKVRRTLINLVVNAIKFSNDGGVVTVSAARDEAGDVVVSVIDRGSGLPEDEARALFDRFRQGGQGRRQNTKGFGLGLNIVRELVAINLGTVSVESELGRGSTFSFTLMPYDVERIVDAFLDRVAERAPDAMLAVLAARRSSGDPSIDELRSFVASVCHPTDIQLPGADGCSTILIGETLEPSAWRTRLQREDAASGAASPLYVEHLGSWALPRVREAILGFVRPSEVVCHD